MPRSNGAAVRGSRLKIATDVAGILESSKAPAKNGAICSHLREWRLTALSAGPGPAESAMGQWRKCLTVVRFRSGLHTTVRRAGSCGYQESAERLQALVAVAVDL